MLTGSGTGTVQHAVSLSWTSSTSAGVVGYNLYRGTVSGGPYTQIVSRDSAPTYSDNTVVGGQTYFYVVTSVDGSGAESVYSNQAQAVVPTP
jgi:fibronectin type 3 domain-containing protein